MIASVPSIALRTPPETGASSSGMPIFARSANSSRVPTGEDELMSTTIESRASFGARPFAPSSTSRTILPSGSIVMTTRQDASPVGSATRSQGVSAANFSSVACTASITTRR
jgi:hypothetical protein